MHIAHSSFNTIASNLIQSATEPHEQSNNEAALRYLAYQTVCSKYRDEIAAIQKYIPGWIPKFY